jgi:hypothetical protein
MINLGPFTGIVSALDPEHIPGSAASDLLNVTLEDGRIRPRFGYQNLNPAPSPWQKAWGIDYVAGFGASNTLVEEYISFENRGAGILPSSVDVSTGVRTAITNGGSTPAALTAPTGSQPGIRSFSFNNYAYCISPGETTAPGVYKHQIGNNSSWIPMNAPANPTANLVIVPYQTVKDDGTGGKMLWDDGTASGLAASAVTVSGPNLCVGGVPSPASSGGTLTLTHNNIGGGLNPQTESFEVLLTGTHGPGLQNWTNVDRIAIPIQTSLMLDGTQIAVQIANHAGTVFLPDQINVIGPPPAPYASNTYTVVCDFKYKPNRADFAQIEKIKLSYVEIGGNDQNPQYLKVSPILVGNVDCNAYDDAGQAVSLVLGYTYYSSVTGLESGIAGVQSLKPDDLAGLKIADTARNQNFPLYARLKLYLTKNTGTGFDGLYDNYRIYARRTNDHNWHQVATIALAHTTTSGGNAYAGATYDSTVDYLTRWNDVLALPILTPGTRVFSGVACAAPYKGWVVWGFRGGYQNIRHSKVGVAETLYNNADSTMLDPENLGAPATQTLADNAGDDPVAIFQSGDSLIVLGSNGVYASRGASPATMTPFRKVPTALGCAGQFACCRWHDAMGNPAVAFLSKNGEGIYLAQEDPYFLNTTHYKVVELTTAVRGLLKAFLIDGQGLADFSSLRMGVDENRDALWVVAGHRAMVYRRPSLVDQERHWELYDYGIPASGSIAYLAFSTKWRMRWIRSSGEMDELEYNSANGSWITGVDADAGSPLNGGIYWTSKTFTGPNRRMSRIRIDRQNLADTPTVRDLCTRKAWLNSTNPGAYPVPYASVTAAAGRYHARFGMNTRGYEHQFTVVLPDGSGYVRRLEIDESGPLGKEIYS